MKRYLSLVLALILALSVFCGVSVFAEDAEVDVNVNRVPMCPHLFELESTTYSQWKAKNCTTDYRDVTEKYKCVICSFKKTDSHEETRDANPTRHKWKYDGTVQRNGKMCTRYKCEECGTFDIR